MRHISYLLQLCLRQYQLTAYISLKECIKDIDTLKHKEYWQLLSYIVHNQPLLNDKEILKDWLQYRIEKETQTPRPLLQVLKILYKRLNSMSKRQFELTTGGLCHLALDTKHLGIITQPEFDRFMNFLEKHKPVFALFQKPHTFYWPQGNLFWRRMWFKWHIFKTNMIYG